MTKLQQTILQNVVNSNFSEDKSCVVQFSRFDRSEISLMKNLFELDTLVRGTKPVEAQQRWSEMINSSQLNITFEAQAQYVNVHMKELFPDIQKKTTKKP